LGRVKRQFSLQLRQAATPPRLHMFSGQSSSYRNCHTNCTRYMSQLGGWRASMRQQIEIARVATVLLARRDIDVILRTSIRKVRGQEQSIDGVCARVEQLLRFRQWSAAPPLQAWREGVSGACSGSGQRRARLSRAHKPTHENAPRFCLGVAVPWGDLGREDATCCGLSARRPLRGGGRRLSGGRLAVQRHRPLPGALL
jgi:hypothetical protein